MKNKLIFLPQDEFNKFGRFINAETVAGQKPDSADIYSAYRQGVDCGELHDVNLVVGFLSVFARTNPVEEMERHNRYGEIFTCVRGEGMLPVCDGDNPCLEKIKFFRILAGDSLLIRRGIWHCPPIPIGDCKQIDFIMFLPTDILNDIEKQSLSQPFEVET
jgi:Ureidoglycolate hydrolase